MTHVMPCNPVAKQPPSLGPLRPRRERCQFSCRYVPTPDLLPGPPHTATDQPARGRPARSQSRTPAPRPDSDWRLRVAAPRGEHWQWQRADYSIGMSPLRTGAVNRGARRHRGPRRCAPARRTEAALRRRRGSCRRAAIGHVAGGSQAEP